MATHTAGSLEDANRAVLAAANTNGCAEELLKISLGQITLEDPNNAELAAQKCIALPRSNRFPITRIKREVRSGLLLC